MIVALAGMEIADPPVAAGGGQQRIAAIARGIGVVELAEGFFAIFDTRGNRDRARPARERLAIDAEGAGVLALLGGDPGTRSVK